MKISAVIVAGGKGKRMGAGINKVFLPLNDKEIIVHTVEAFYKNANISEIIVVTGKDDINTAKKLLDGYNVIVTEGGRERQQSVKSGIDKASGDIVLIHDGARALISQKEIDNVISDCVKFGAAAVGVKVKDTLKAVDDGFITGTVDRDATYKIQTPQSFKTDVIKELHKNADRDGFFATEDCMIAEHYGVRVKITEGSYDNLKLTTPEDIEIAENILRRRNL